jgi:hypothetical protein
MKSLSKKERRGDTCRWMKEGKETEGQTRSKSASDEAVEMITQEESSSLCNAHKIKMERMQ